MNILKKLLPIILVLGLLISIAGCTGDNTQKTEPATDAQILAVRREQVVAYMREMMSFLWKSDVDITYSKNNNTTGVENDEESNLVHIVAGRIYQGMPYTHGSGSFASFVSYASQQDEKGVYTISGLSAENLSGEDGKGIYMSRIGNDCADAVFWAWSQVSSTIKFRKTYYMTEINGCIPVGEYKLEYTDKTKDRLADSERICLENGEAVMYEAYAHLQMGDSVVKTTEGHAMMISEVKVTRDENGMVIPSRSFVKIIEQTSGVIQKEKVVYNETLKADVYQCGNVDKVMTFVDLFNSRYLPVTCKELIDASPVAVEEVKDSESTYGVDNMFTGTFTSPYRISHVTVTISDGSGKVVQKSTCYGREEEMRAFDLSRFVQDTEQPSLQGIINLDDLSVGTYRCTFTCEIATGKVFTVRDFEFTK